MGQKEIYGQFEQTFLFYLPRLCEHCLNPSCAAVCPSGAIYKREEDGIVLIDQEKCRGWRMCVSGCPIQEDLLQLAVGKSEKCIFCYPRIEAGLPTVCSETCVGRIRYLGVLLYDADRIEEAASVPNEQDLYEAQLGLFLDPNDQEIAELARRDGVPDSWLEAAKLSPVWKMAMDWKVAFPLHPEYRTLPMVWYIPPLSPIQSAAEDGGIDVDEDRMPDVRSLRIPLQYLANLLTAGDETPVALRSSACWRCACSCGASTSMACSTRACWTGSGCPNIRSRRCTVTWRSPTTRIASSSRPATRSWASRPTTSAASAGSPSARAAAKATALQPVWPGHPQDARRARIMKRHTERASC